MASEDRSEFFGILFVRSEPFQIFAGTAAAVIQQDGRKTPAAIRAEEQSVPRERAVVDESRSQVWVRIQLGRLWRAVWRRARTLRKPTGGSPAVRQKAGSHSKPKDRRQEPAEKRVVVGAHVVEPGRPVVLGVQVVLLETLD